MKYSILAFSLGLCACSLKTVSDLRTDPVPRPTAPAKPAPVTSASRFEEYDEQIRQMNGRVEVLESRLAQMSSERQNETSTEARERETARQKLAAYEDAIRKVEVQVAALNEEIVRLKMPPPTPAPAKGRSSFDEGEELFAQRRWKEAIVAFQKYRDANPKGKLYADATLKIGSSFAELGLKDEAKSFFEEVVARFPGSKEAKKASARIKSAK